MVIEIANLPFPCFLLDHKFAIQGASPSAINLFSERQSFFNLVDGEFFNDAKEFFQSSFSDEPIVLALFDENNKKHYFNVYKSKGREGMVMVYCIPLSGREELHNSKAGLKEFLDISLDSLYQKIDELRALNDTREEIGKLAAGIAHEIRNPLTIVKGFLQLLMPELKELGKERYASVSIEEINRADKIISEFLSGTKHPSNVKTKTSINQLVKEVILLYESECILRNIRLVASLSEVDFTFILDASQFKQVLINMLKNAIEAIDSAPHLHSREIAIFTKTKKDAFIIGIKDNGCGMEPETVNRLFTPFFSTKPNGNGLGLNISRKIIEEHGASIQVESKAGVGSLFSILFPIKIPVCS
ncbi:ATP-binding protein [Neobacillus sp. YIM B06451]|uniref:two-component system sensor histidine kinase NtrB n=1 Tax=Neobacillus sp. YIM B06451 TaxID=3070994 RepID=UPI00292D8B9A|nr:ATP-binding protein [Neobacillus sp. YIM B06451]